MKDKNKVNNFDATTSFFFILILKQIKISQKGLSETHRKIWKQYPAISYPTFFKYFNQLESKNFVFCNRNPNGKRIDFAITAKGLKWLDKAEPILPILIELKREF